MRRTIYTNDFNDFLGNGFAAEPLPGQLDSDFWTVSGFSSTSDLTRGETSGSISTGGIYAVNRGNGEGNGLLIQPTGGDFTPGDLMLTLNSGASDLSDVVVSFERLLNNDATRGNAFNLSYSLDGLTFIQIDSFTSAAAPDANGITSQTVAVMLPDLTANSQFQLRWSGADASGSGSRDEFGIDNLLVDGLEGNDSTGAVFTLELLHIADQEASSAAVIDAPNLSAVLNALRAQDLGDDGLADNTLTLSSGDAIIPGIFFDASQAVFGSEGIADIQIQNELGIQAIALGNHEFDFGTEVLADLISGAAPGEIFGADFTGAAFPYLSANLDFPSDANLAPLAVAGGGAPLAGTVTSSVVLETNGEKIGVVGATTPTLDRISNPGDLTILPGAFDDNPTSEQLDALAAQIQTEVDALVAADPSLNKIVLLAHMQRISIEQELAARLEDVDIIVAGGSNTRLFDENDRPRDGDSVQGEYPIFVDNAGGTQTAVVNTDGSYKYVGRLVIDFDEDGNIIPGSYDAEISGAYATDAQGVAALGAEGLVDPEIQAIADAIEAQIIATESNVFGTSDVFLNGNRAGVDGDPDGVRTQETNLGNLTADANLAAAKEADADVVVSIKNGGGIRASIGETLVLPGDTSATRLPNGEIVDGDGNVVKPQGGISQNDIQTTLAFNNDLTLLTLTRAELVAVLEHGLAGLPDAAGRFPQVSGVEFSFDPDLPAGERIVNAEIIDADGNSIAELIRDGALSGDPGESFRIVTLNFLAGGGDGYPFPTGDAANRVDLAIDGAPRTGDATFADDGTEQDALAEYLADLDAPYDEADGAPDEDARIQNLNFREDAVFGDGGTGAETFVESFEQEPGETYTINGAFDDGGFDFFGRFDAPDNNNGARDDFNGFDGDFAIYAQDNDGEGGPATQVINIPDIDLTGYDAPKLTLALGALDSADFQNYEAGDGIRIYATLDGGERVLIGQFANDGAPGNLRQDTDLDGIGDGDTLTTFLQDFTFDLPEGDVLSVDVELTSNASFEPLVVDNLRVGDEGDGGTGGSVDIDDDPTVVSAIQGTGSASVLVGQTVVIEAIVTGDFQNGDDDTFRDLGGFFVMEENEDRDGDAASSEGIFIYEGSGALLSDVDDGDRVRILGTVVERFGKTTIEATEIRLEEAGAADPLSLAVTTTLPDLEDREALESMLVTVDEALTFSESFDYEDFGDATLSTDGPVYQFSQINAPDAEANAAYQDDVANRTITISGGGSGRREDFDPITEPDGDLIGGPTDGVRMGQSVSELTAIVDFDFGEYRLRLPEDVFFELDADTNPVPTAPEDVGSAYKVASLNVLNYFTTIERLTDNGNNPRGADDLEELARQTDKLVEAILGLDSDVIGLIEIENDFAGESFALQTLVAAINAQTGTDDWAFIDPGQEFVGDDAIAVAFIYDSSTTQLVGDAKILDTDAFLNPLGAGTGGDTFNRAALAQTFQEIETGGIFTASVNHFKSKGSLTGAAEDEDQGDGAGRNNATRTEAARELAEWLAQDPTGSGDDDVIILGDLNAYARETPITTLEDAGYTDLARSFEGDDVYSYRFSGQIGTLDYALANDALLDQVTGATTWNINSDTPVFFDYNTDDTFTGPNTLRPTDQGLFDGESPLRASDHDPVIIGLALEDDRALIVAGTDKNDRLNGTQADEIIIGGGGRVDVVRGGGGSDTFVFTDLDASRDFLRILDFDTADDILDLDGSQITSTRTLGNNLLINLDEDRDAIFLFGVTDIETVTIINDEQLLS